MKLASILSFFLIAVTLSCSMEKRVHSRGYYIDWNEQKPQTAKINTSKTNDSIKTSLKSKLKFETLERENQHEITKNSEIPNLLEPQKDALESTLTNKTDTLESTVIIQNDLKNINNLTLDQKKSTTIKPSFIQKGKSKTKILYSNTYRPNGAGLITLGLSIMIVGLVFLLFPPLIYLTFLSLVVGFFFLLLGAVIRSTMQQTKKPNTRNADVPLSKNQETNPEVNAPPLPKKYDTPNKKYRDVVYLNNGGMIKGEIIEYLPGDYMKIKTLEGVIITFKTSEVEKTVKEEISE